MADPTAERESVVETLLEKIDDKFHGEDSSSSDSDTEVKSPSSSAVKAKIYRLFGREEPLHKVLGGGKPADIFLWRQKKITAGVLGVATTIWVLFELFEYHLLTLLCHILILAFTALFLWSNACKFINKAPPPIPDFELPADIVTGVASAFRIEINRALALIHQTAAGKDLKKFLLIALECSTRNPGFSGACHEILDFVWRVMPTPHMLSDGILDFVWRVMPTPHMLSDGILDFVLVAGLWIISIIGGYCHFLTLFYISFVLLHTIPVIYEKYEDQVDSIAEKAEAEIKKHFAEFNVKFLSKIPIKQLKEKKFA